VTGLGASAVQDVFDTGLGISVPISADGAGVPVVDVPVERWLDAAELARRALALDFLDWLSAVDEPDADPPGVDVVVHLADSRAITRRLLLRTRTDAAAPRLASLTGLWPGAAWHERETYEMFGVVFDGFDDGQRAPGSGGVHSKPAAAAAADAGLLGLRPLLLPDGFEGTPLRKSFVLAARVSKPWPGAKEPGEGAGGAPSRRKTRPPGVPDPSWGPHEPGAPADADAPQPSGPAARRPGPRRPGAPS
jgi:NADH-quinone oxidoreductase subunit C